MNTILLQTNSQSSSVIFVLGLFFLFILLVAVGLKGGKGYKQLKASYEGKIKQEYTLQYCQGFFTEDEFIINVKGGKACYIYKLDSIKTAAASWDKTNRTWNLVLRDENGKWCKGEYSDGKNRKSRKLGTQFPVGQEAAETLVGLLMKHAPHITKADI